MNDKFYFRCVLFCYGWLQTPILNVSRSQMLGSEVYTFMPGFSFKSHWNKLILMWLSRFALWSWYYRERTRLCACVRRTEDTTGDVAEVPSTVLLGWTLPLALPSRLAWLSSEPQRSACLCLPSTNFHAHTDIQLFLYMDLGIKLGSLLLTIQALH